MFKAMETENMDEISAIMVNEEAEAQAEDEDGLDFNELLSLVEEDEVETDEYEPWLAEVA